MSNLIDEIEYRHLEDVLEFALEQYKKGLYTAIPGIVQSYNPSTKRATVMPAIKRVYTDDTSQSMPIIQDVPILFPTGGGYTVTMPIAQGDPVMIVFSQRGIENFKLNFLEALPGNGMMSLPDAVAIPGFGALGITPASSTGATMQSNDGQNAIVIEQNQVQVKLGTSATVTLTSESIVLDLGGATLTLTDSSLVSSVPISAPSYSGVGGDPAEMTSGLNMGNNPITNASEVTSQSGINLTTHVHPGVESGSDETGEPT